MNELRWRNRPKLKNPVIIAAFSGWNDAGDAATSTISYLSQRWGASKFATLDSEDFYDYSETRPVIKLPERSEYRKLEWPSNDFYAGQVPGLVTRDIIFIKGVEPQLRWRSFCRAILDIADDYDASQIVTLGSLLADVPHTRPAPVSGWAHRRTVFDRLNIPNSNYEGPTGIVGVLQHEAEQQGYPSASLWVAVPHYVGQTSSPKATLALVRTITDALNVPVDTTDLQIATSAYETQVSDIVNADEEMAEYVSELETAEDDAQQVDLLAEEAERFLREQGG